jgi:uncharacterized protein
MSDIDTAATPPTDAATAPAPRRHRDVPPVAWLTAVIVILAVVMVGVVGVAFGRNDQSAASTNPPATITVTGTGTVQGAPDTLSFSIGVDSVAANAVAALEENNAHVKALESTLVRYGVLSKDLQTSNLDIYQRTNNEGQPTGWEVDDSLNVTVRDLKKAGVIIDAAAHTAGDGISFGGVTFSISNDSAYLAAARKQAMQSAMTEASQLAAGAGHTVTGILRVTDQESGASSPPLPFAYFDHAATSAVPIEAGRQPVDVQVTVVYTLSS